MLKQVSYLAVLLLPLTACSNSPPAADEPGATASLAPQADAAGAQGLAPLLAEPLEPGESVRIGHWLIQGGSDDTSVRLTSSFGEQWIGQAAERGYQFALIPVFVSNVSETTDTLGLVTWELRDDEGYEYSLQAMGDLYLAEHDRLNVTNVLPEETRGGYLVFQIRQDANELYLTYQEPEGSATWRYTLR